jgi:hypothetical protein
MNALTSWDSHLRRSASALSPCRWKWAFPVGEELVTSQSSRLERNPCDYKRQQACILWRPDGEIRRLVQGWVG